MATRFLVSSVIPRLADDIKANRNVFTQTVSSFVHKTGVNIRHLGLLRYLLCDEADLQRVLLEEIISLHRPLLEQDMGSTT